MEFSETLKMKADRISTLILMTEMPESLIIREINKLHEFCCRLHPDKAELFELIYVRRFLRLWEQFRGKANLLKIRVESGV